ncbi:hypothetical protein [Cupriavidus alkaliphilus]|uniref:hypothetical protein n=1 Tax=Cupriavidus alkaliphilus TaxID=942866 RepID=UPI001622FA90|nr:hypothetical protein [Cupriavidus alkaliphilus]MBB2915891.1 hypothetical protein [Cupriavidus alkaliphilus]
MTRDEMTEVLSLIAFCDYTFGLFEAGGGALYLQAMYVAPDIVTGLPEPQYTRKWQLSQHMTKSEFVQTVFKCCLTSFEHRARESFLYRGVRVYGPHFDVEALVALAKAGMHDVRKPFE